MARYLRKVPPYGTRVDCFIVYVVLRYNLYGEIQHKELKGYMHPSDAFNIRSDLQNGILRMYAKSHECAYETTHGFMVLPKTVRVVAFEISDTSVVTIGFKSEHCYQQPVQGYDTPVLVDDVMLPEPLRTKRWIPEGTHQADWVPEEPWDTYDAAFGWDYFDLV